ncbi:MAG TPA: hypothetical protein PKZ36_03325 [Candidatus Paceibacterota bacterium]|nr:hypothetical protein [Candidatus Paceibacterota bacterium]HPT18408.1 hypothetical protein [Candidatus Paceibacterota bacterium]
MLFLSQFFAILASLFAVAEYTRYSYQIHKTLSSPNPVTVALWVFEAIINVITYFEAVKDFWQTLITITNLCLVVGIFFIALLCKKFSKIKVTEVICIFLVVFIGIFWVIDGNDQVSNALLQIVYFISFLPIAYQILHGEKEHQAAWILGIISGVFATLTVICNYTGEKISLVYPIVNIIGNGLIVILIYSYRTKKAEYL